MHTKSFVLTIASGLLLACSSGSGGTGFVMPGEQGGSSGGGAGSSGVSGGSSGNYGTASSGASGSSGGLGTSSSSSSSSSGGPSDAGSGPPVGDGGTLVLDGSIPAADFGQTQTLSATPFVVAAGAEVYKCQKFANPFGGDVDLLQMHGVMTAGSHHFFLFNLDPTSASVYTTTLEDCPGGGIEFHPFPFLSQQPDFSTQYPTAADGSPMGYPLPAANFLMINVHYLNASSAAITANATITIRVAKPGVVNTHVGTLFLNNTTLTVPVTPMASPMEESMSWAGDPSLAANYSIFSSWSHMHKWSLALTASTNGSVFYTETNWDNPQVVYHNPVIPMTSSQTITWSCNYYNDTGNTLTFGDSAIKNVMCIYLGQYFPASATRPDIIDILN
jgi:hypothetical protein